MTATPPGARSSGPAMYNSYFFFTDAANGFIIENSTIRIEPNIIIPIPIFCEIVSPHNPNGLSSRTNSMKNLAKPYNMNIMANVQPGLAQNFSALSALAVFPIVATTG